VDIELTQRGSPAVVSRSAYEEHWCNGLETLVAHRIIRLEHRADLVLVYPNQYVGTARCAGRRLRIQARYPELLLQLRRNFPLHRRDVPLEGFDPADERKTTSDFAVRFLTALSEVINHGVPFNYKKRQYEGPSLVGSLNVGQTIRRFASRNIHHEAVTERSVKTFDSTVVDVIWHATDVLREFGVLSAHEEAALDVMLTAIELRCRELSLSEALSAAESLPIKYTDRPDIVELAACCLEVLAHNRTEYDIEAATGDVSFSFTDADALWERAVHQAMQQSVSPRGWRARLHPLRGTGFRLFEDGGPEIDPDVLAYFHDNSVLMPVDAKDFAQRSADASGVYQVTAYARALHAPTATLIYLAFEEDWVEEFGEQSLRIYAVGVRPTGTDVLIRLARACGEIAARAVDFAPTNSTA
jgi:hypothetical protein